MKQIAFVMLALICGSSYAQTLTTNACYVRDPNASPREHNIDIERQKKLRLNPPKDW